MTEDFDLMELDKIIADVAKVDKARKMLSSNIGKNGADIIDLRKTVSDWERKYLWTTDSRVAIFSRYTCTCGECTTVFSHWMVRQHHNSSKILRYVRLTAEVDLETYPASRQTDEHGLQIIQVPMCPVCCAVDLTQLPVLEVKVPS